MERRNKELFNPLAKIISIHEARTKHQQSQKENFKKKISWMQVMIIKKAKKL